MDATEKSLEQIRDELDFLRFSRTIWGLRPLDAARYQELCELEQKILRDIAAA